MFSHGRSVVIWKNISSVANISKLETLICRMKMLHFVWHIPVLFFMLSYLNCNSLYDKKDEVLN